MTRPEDDQNKSAGAEAGSRRLVTALLQLLRAWLALLSQPGGAKRRSAPRPWRLHVGRRPQQTPLTQADVNRLLQRHRDLKDAEKIADSAARFHLPESDFFADPARVEHLLRRFLEEDPPWLHMGRVLTGGEQGSASGHETIWRERETRTVEELTLFVPDESWRDRPLASLTMQPARALREAWQARLLDQVLPAEILLDRISRGEVLIPVRQGKGQRLEFKPERRRVEIVTRRPVAVPVETEGSDGRGGQLLYFLLDGSASMQGQSAVLALAVIAAVVRANMGHADTRYLFRRYADQDGLWPREVEPPLQARSVADKDAFLDTLLATDFNGRATHVNQALGIAASDIEALRRTAQLDAAILLVTDGRAEMLGSTDLRLRGAGIKLHTVMVTPERNPSLQSISESFTSLDIRLDLPQDGRKEQTVVPSSARTRRAYHI